MRYHQPSTSRAWIGFLVLILSMASGCGSILFKNPTTVKVRSNVPASVTVEGEGKGCSSPGEVSLDRSKDHFVKVAAAGHEAQTVKLESRASWWRIATSVILNGFLSTPTLWIATPFLCAVDIDAGAWQHLDPGLVDVELVPGNGAPITSTPKPVEPPSKVAAASASKTCSSCGATLEGKKFCTSCGARVQ